MANWLKQGWREFEEEVTALTQAFGYAAETTQASHDFGVDVIAQSDRRRVLIQCKLYGGGQVSGPEILKLIGSRHHFAATDALLITTGRFTRQAKEIANQNSVHLVDGNSLIELCVTKKLTIPSLTVLIGTNDTVFPAKADFLTVGRLDDNHIMLPHSSVSRKHAVLRRNKLQLSVEDLLSLNGTQVNGVQIGSPSLITYGDEVRFGSTAFCVGMEVKGRIRRAL